VAYAVPSNSSSTIDSLANFYDTTAQSYYQNFSLSLQQVACNTSNSAQYSLARTCTDCANDYKTWVCAVTIPRCTDFSSSSNTGVIARNIAQNTTNGTVPDLSGQDLPSNATSLPWFSGSRNPAIDTVIQPGPYKEFLPCINLCYEIVKSCPAVMGFGCPKQEQLQNKSYGIWDTSVDWPGTCSYLGRDPVLGASSRTVPAIMLIITVGLLHCILTWMS
jgi:calcium channel MID1